MTEPGVGTNRYAYANNDPVNKFDPEGNSWISNIIGIALSFIPGLQPAGAALIAAGLSAVETVAAGGDLGDAIKSATITFAVQMAMHHFSEGVFGRADAPDALAGAGAQPDVSTRGWKIVDDVYRASRVCKAALCRAVNRGFDRFERVGDRLANKLRNLPRILRGGKARSSTSVLNANVKLSRADQIILHNLEPGGSAIITINSTSTLVTKNFSGRIVSAIPVNKLPTSTQVPRILPKKPDLDGPWITRLVKILEKGMQGIDGMQ